jgi:hypothetical protein
MGEVVPDQFQRRASSAIVWMAIAASARSAIAGPNARRSPCPRRSPSSPVQGTADTDVGMSVALRLLDRARGPDIRLTLVKDADHRFSSPACLALVERSVEEIATAHSG